MSFAKNIFCVCTVPALVSVRVIMVYSLMNCVFLLSVQEIRGTPHDIAHDKLDGQVLREALVLSSDDEDPPPQRLSGFAKRWHDKQMAAS